MNQHAFRIGDRVRFTVGPYGAIVNLFDVDGTQRFAKVKCDDGRVLILSLREILPAPRQASAA